MFNYKKYLLIFAINLVIMWMFLFMVKAFTSVSNVSSGQVLTPTIFNDIISRVKGMSYNSWSKILEVDWVVKYNNTTVACNGTNIWIIKLSWDVFYGCNWTSWKSLIAGAFGWGYFAGLWTNLNPFRKSTELATDETVWSKSCQEYNLNATTLNDWVTRESWICWDWSLACLDSWVYRIDPDWAWWNSAFNVYCDMKNDRWWWTLVWENYNWWMNVSTAVWTISFSDAWSDQWKLADTIINAIKSTTSASVNGYRISYDSYPNKYYWAASCVFNASVQVTSWVCGNWSVADNYVWTYAGDWVTWRYWLWRRKSSRWNNWWSMPTWNYLYRCYSLAYSAWECTYWYPSWVSQASEPVNNPWTNLRVR